MDIVLDFTFIYKWLAIAEKGAFSFAWYLFIKGGWLAFLYVILWYLHREWSINKSLKWFKTQKFILLAIDIPKDTEQTPKAIEQLFATISGAHNPLEWIEKFRGMFQLSFSLEIVSIDGYVQFLIRTQSQYRNLIETAIFSQYPDAEITEVEDYVHKIPTKFPSDDYEMWGSEVVLVNDSAYPIRTYKEFEDKVSGEFKDPMAAILETMSKIETGEQAWIQIIVRPADFGWEKKSQALVYKMAGKKQESKISVLNKIIDSFMFLIDNIFGIDLVDKQEKKDEKFDTTMWNLTPGERDVMEAIERKASKIGFDCKMRLIYLSPPQQFNPGRVIAPIFGSLKQFSTLNLNAFKPDSQTKTSVYYYLTTLRKNIRRTKLMRGYKGRSSTRGYPSYLLNIEELATLWHFPNKYIKIPLLQKTTFKTGEPPASLPATSSSEEESEVLTGELKSQLNKTKDFDIEIKNDYFEKKFAKEKGSSEYRKKLNKIGGPPSNLPTE